MTIAIIPARGGSKRIPGKNIKPFYGKPIIAWSIEAAILSRLFDRVIVSTDDNAIAQIAETYGAEVPFSRPRNLSDDYSGIQPVIAHAIGALRVRSREAICVLLPTAPFVQSADLINSRLFLDNKDVKFVISVASFPYPPQRAMITTDAGVLSMMQDSNALKRSQDLPEACHDAGQFYWGWSDAWLVENNILASASVGYQLPRKMVQDIDTPEDWEFAELLFKLML